MISFSSPFMCPSGRLALLPVLMFLLPLLLLLCFSGVGHVPHASHLFALPRLWSPPADRPWPLALFWTYFVASWAPAIMSFGFGYDLNGWKSDAPE